MIAIPPLPCLRPTYEGCCNCRVKIRGSPRPNIVMKATPTRVKSRVRFR